MYDDGTLNDVFVESVDPSILHSLWLYWAQNGGTDLKEIVF